MLKNIKDPRIAIIVVMLLIAVFLSYRYFSAPNTQQPPQDIKVVEVEKVQLKDITQTTRLTATIQAKYASMLVAQDHGILEIIHDSGSKVKKSELIARIANTEIEKNYQLLENAKNIAEEQFKRASHLLKSGAFSKAEFETTKNNFILAQKNFADSKIALDKLKFYAPFDGVVGHYKIKSGQQVHVGEKIVSFYDPGSIRVDFDIPASVIADVNNGQNVLIMEKNYQLASVQKMLDEDKHMTPASVDITCDNCIIGANTYVDLSLLGKKQVIVIPFEAVFLRQGKTAVYVVKENKIEFRPVTLGIREKELVEVISGLAVGEEIISCNTSRLYPGTSVKIHQPE